MGRDPFANARQRQLTTRMRALKQDLIDQRAALLARPPDDPATRADLVALLVVIADLARAEADALTSDAP